MIRNPSIAYFVARQVTPIVPCSVTLELYGYKRWVLVEQEVRREIKHNFFWASEKDVEGAVLVHRERVEKSWYSAGARVVA
jgi:hypothetical protein